MSEESISKMNLGKETPFKQCNARVFLLHCVRCISDKSQWFKDSGVNSTLLYVEC